MYYTALLIYEDILCSSTTDNINHFHLTELITANKGYYGNETGGLARPESLAG